MQNAVRELVEQYFAMWNETDAARRAALIASVWSAEPYYVDPMFEARGAAALDGLVNGVHTQYPGHRFRLVGEPEAHHERARWDWALVSPAGAPIRRGVDFATLSGEARLREVVGFFSQ
jgi:hypothetical protein